MQIDRGEMWCSMAFTSFWNDKQVTSHVYCLWLKWLARHAFCNLWRSIKHILMAYEIVGEWWANSSELLLCLEIKMHGWSMMVCCWHNWSCKVVVGFLCCFFLGMPYFIFPPWYISILINWKAWTHSLANILYFMFFNRIWNW